MVAFGEKARARVAKAEVDAVVANLVVEASDEEKDAGTRAVITRSLPIRVCGATRKVARSRASRTPKVADVVLAARSGTRAQTVRPIVINLDKPNSRLVKVSQRSLSTLEYQALTRGSI